jgi:predicted TPR repeat methyltransferase
LSEPKPGSEAETFFDTIAEWYDTAERAIDIAPFLTGCAIEIRRYLDLGAGTGSTIENALECVAPESIVAVDVSAKMLELLRSKRPGVETIRCDIVTYLHEAGRPFDLITSIGVLELISDADFELVTSGTAKALRPGGLFVLTYEPIVATVRTQQKSVDKALDWEGVPLTSYRRDAEWVRSALTRHGFRIRSETRFPQAYQNRHNLPVTWELVVAERRGRETAN